MDSVGNKNSDPIVALQIAARFFAKGLLPEEYIESFQKQLAEGRMTEEDWRLWAEKALEFETKGSGEHEQQ